MSLSERGSSDIPFFIINRPGKKSKGKEKELKEKEINLHTQITGYNLVEIKCLKCTTYYSEIYELKNIEGTS